MSKNKKKILVILGRGGHTEQTLRLVDKLGDRYEYEYVVGKEDNTSKDRVKYEGKINTVLNPRQMTDTSLVIVIIKLIPSSIQALKILLNSKPDAILSAGPSLALPFFFFARLLRIKTIFIESWVRVKNKSITGRLLYPFSDLFFIQWTDLKYKYPKAIYAGRLS